MQFRGLIKLFSWFFFKNIKLLNYLKDAEIKPRNRKAKSKGIRSSSEYDFILKSSLRSLASLLAHTNANSPSRLRQWF